MQYVSVLTGYEPEELRSLCAARDSRGRPDRATLFLRERESRSEGVSVFNWQNKLPLTNTQV